MNKYVIPNPDKESKNKMIIVEDINDPIITEEMKERINKIKESIKPTDFRDIPIAL